MSDAPVGPSFPHDPARHRALVQAVHRAADPTGFLRFDRLLEIALYEPGYGFYDGPGAAVGREGAFYTATHASPLFAATLARRLLDELDALGAPENAVVVEAGAADGHLAEGVLGALADEAERPRRLTYRLIERSATLRTKALERLGRLALPGGWEVEIGESVGSDGPFEGAVVANELLDALPFRRVVRRGGLWREQGVRVVGEAIEWAEGGTADDLELPREAANDLLLEVPTGAVGFLREVADHLLRGAALLLDYGAEQPELERRWPRGTLAGWRSHRAVDRPLADLGEVDLSAFVNFTRLRAAARAFGLAEVAYRPQAEALVAWGLEAIARASPPGPTDALGAVRQHLGVKNLLYGFENFRVLELRAAGAAASASP